ncbi:hypothetical protein [Desulfocurvus sp. DL9XJH121]
MGFHGAFLLIIREIFRPRAVVHTPGAGKGGAVHIAGARAAPGSRALPAHGADAASRLSTCPGRNQENSMIIGFYGRFSRFSRNMKNITAKNKIFRKNEK